MFTVHSQLMDSRGFEIEARDHTSNTITLALLSATTWGSGALLRAEERLWEKDFYVQHTWTQSNEQ